MQFSGESKPTNWYLKHPIKFNNLMMIWMRIKGQNPAETDYVDYLLLRHKYVDIFVHYNSTGINTLLCFIQIIRIAGNTFD